MEQLCRFMEEREASYLTRHSARILDDASHIPDDLPRMM